MYLHVGKKHNTVNKVFIKAAVSFVVFYDENFGLITYVLQASRNATLFMVSIYLRHSKTKVNSRCENEI